MTLHSGLSSVKSYSFRMRNIWFTVSYAADVSYNVIVIVRAFTICSGLCACTEML